MDAEKRPEDKFRCLLLDIPENTPPEQRQGLLELSKVMLAEAFRTTRPASETKPNP